MSPFPHAAAATSQAMTRVRAFTRLTLPRTWGNSLLVRVLPGPRPRHAFAAASDLDLVKAGLAVAIRIADRPHDRGAAARIGKVRVRVAIVIVDRERERPPTRRGPRGVIGAARTALLATRGRRGGPRWSGRHPARRGERRGDSIRGVIEQLIGFASSRLGGARPLRGGAGRDRAQGGQKQQVSQAAPPHGRTLQRIG